MGTNPYQDQNADQSNQYGGYGGYTPQNDPAQGGQYNYGGTQGTDDPNYQYGQQQQQQQYQYGTYQPPASAARRGYGSSTGGAGDTSAFGVNAKNAAAISYIGIFITGIVLFLIERKNQFVRFCAAQSTITFGAAFIIYVLLRFISALPIIGFLLSPILGCLTTVLLAAAGLLWVFLIVQAYRGVKVKLPIIGDYAEILAQRFK
jgi:uncharacterized membrane protein